MKKALFLIFHGFAAHNGISKKIHYQVNAMRECGIDTKLCYLDMLPDHTHRRMIDDIVLEDYGNGFMSKIKKRISYGALADYILKNDFDFLYIRSAHNANPFLNSFLKKVHSNGIKTAMEIPTYPYEGQFKGASREAKIRFRIDLLCRDTMAKYLDYMVSFTELPTILGVPNIPISNGIDFNETPVKTQINDTTKKINFIGVAELHYWHGFDRMIAGMAQYYATKKSDEPDVAFNIVGTGFGSEYDKLKAQVSALNLDDKVIFQGNKSGDELTRMFEINDMGIASLGRHRSGNTRIKTLKNREYAARGIPFVYSEIDDDFEAMPYITKAPADESAIDIRSLISFYQNVKMTPEQIRNSIINTLSWHAQMQKIIDTVSKK
ncbi:MAG: hypothetical protein PHD21_01270 [Flavobacteriales bacterium]|nr:hypothetical protein [Flavobacteriales bacterium]